MGQFQFTTKEELISYLESLENRCSSLENDVHSIKEEINDISSENQECLDLILELPNSLLFSDNFLIRALAVWGHYFVAQLFIGIIMAIFLFIIIILIVGGSNGFFNALQNLF